MSTMPIGSGSPVPTPCREYFREMSGYPTRSCGAPGGSKTPHGASQKIVEKSQRAVLASEGRTQVQAMCQRQALYILRSLVPDSVPSCSARPCTVL